MTNIVIKQRINIACKEEKKKKRKRLLNLGRCFAVLRRTCSCCGRPKDALFGKKKKKKKKSL
jgi:hypothetical protein